MREPGWPRSGERAWISRVGYAVTALFGMAMVVLASGIGGGAEKGIDLVLAVAERVGESAPGGRLVFLVGAWAAVFSSLLGVWQATPLISGDLFAGPGTAPGSDRATRRRVVERVSLVLIAALPVPTLLPSVASLGGFEAAVVAYGVVGALFIPALAGSLLIMARPGRGGGLANGVVSTLGLSSALLLFAAFAVLFAVTKLG